MNGFKILKSFAAKIGLQLKYTKLKSYFEKL